MTSAPARTFLAGVPALPSHGDDEAYYEADISDPLHFVFPIEIFAAHGVDFHAGTRILDFGYGSIGHLDLLAAMGVDASGIEVRSKLEQLYANAQTAHVHLFSGRYPAEAPLVAKVGGGYDLITSKNVLKKGYIHPDRPSDPTHQINLGVDDATFLKAFHDALKPGGRMMIYNIFVPVPADQPFQPMSDGRCPFMKDQWSAAGFDVEAFDESDTQRLRAALVPADPAGEAKTYEALYTLTRRRD